MQIVVHRTWKEIWGETWFICGTTRGRIKECPQRLKQWTFSSSRENLQKSQLRSWFTAGIDFDLPFPSYCLADFWNSCFLNFSPGTGRSGTIVACDIAMKGEHYWINASYMSTIKSQMLIVNCFNCRIWASAERHRGHSATGRSVETGSGRVSADERAVLAHLWDPSLLRHEICCHPNGAHWSRPIILLTALIGM